MATPPKDDRPPPLTTTEGQAYADRLEALRSKRWKKVLNVQAPYRANLRRLHLGKTLDVGCGTGRNLEGLPEGSVGVDHNPFLVASACQRGMRAFTVDEFFAEPAVSRPASYDSILASHLIEHLTRPAARAVMARYLPLVKAGGRVVFITPQEKGHASDPTHLEFTDQSALRELSRDLGLTTEKEYSFPLPRMFGKIFTYNEFNHIARVSS
jgi:SAM-dependent methyltransferase